MTLPLKRIRWLILIGVGVGLAACLGLALAAGAGGDGRLRRLGVPRVQAADCLGQNNSLRHGLSFRFSTEWFSEKDVVSVIGRYVRQGWTTTTFMSSDVKLLPPPAEATDLLLLKVQVNRAVSLSYTPDRSTRVVAATLVTLCPP